MTGQSKSDRFTPVLIAHVQSLIQKAKKGLQVVQGWESIIATLTKANLIYVLQLRPDLVGIHSLNRAKFGICPRAMNAHGAKITRQGLSWKKASDATAVEPPTNKKLDDAIKDNNKWVELSNGLLPPLSDMKALSIGGANTNGFLRAARARCPCIVASVAKDGHWNPDELGAEDANLAEALDKGLWWNVIDGQCVEVWGDDLVEVGVAALNAKASTDISENEVMLGMALSADGLDKPDWEVLKARACANNPPCESYIGECATFARENAGAGADTLLVVADYLQCVFGDQSYASRVVGGTFLKHLNGVHFKTTQVPFVKVHAYMAQLVCPTRFVEGGACTMLRKQDVDKLKSQKLEKKVVLAETLISEGKALLQQQPALGRVHRVRLHGTFGCRLVLHICGRGADSSDGRDFENFGEIVSATWHCFRSL